MTAHHSNKAHRIGVAAFFFLLGFCFATWASRIPFIQQKLSLSDSQLGIVLFALPLGSFISLPFAGALVSRFGSRNVTCFAALAYCFTLASIGFAATLFQLFVGLFFFGVIGNTCNISINTQAVGVESLYKKNIMASFHGVWSLAGFGGAALGSAMAGFSIDPRFHFMIVAAISASVFFAAFRYLLSKDAATVEKTPLFAKPDKTLLILGLIAFCCMLCEGTMFDWSGIYFRKVVKPHPSLVGAGYTAFMCAMAISRFVSDYFTNKYGFRPVVQASGIIIMSGLLLSVLLPTFYPAVIGFLLVGVGVSSIVPMVYSAAGKSTKFSPGLALASVSSISFFGFLIGPPVVGLLAGIAGLRLSFAVMAVIGLCVSILGSWTPKRY